MKATKTILAMMAVASLAVAQTPAANKPKAPASQTVTGTTVPAPSTAPAAAAKPKPAAPPASKPAKAVAKAPAKPGKKAVVTATAKPSEAKPAAAAKSSAGKRDPFVSPVVRATAGTGAMCATGKRCLMINEMVLHGIVKTQAGMIAVVSNQANRSYFLKENDPVFNGSVVRITPDSIVFRENMVDNLGKETTREVVKRVSAPPV